MSFFSQHVVKMWSSDSHLFICSPPRPHSPQEEGQLIFHVDVAGRRDSQVSQPVAMATAGPDTGTFAPPTSSRLP